MYADPAPPDPAAAQALGLARLDLDDLLTHCDLVTLHVPLLPATRGLLGEQRLRRMPRGALLINASRGGVVDEHALARALVEGHLGGAAVDVYAAEPPPADSPLLTLPPEAADRVLYTPHIAGVAYEAAQALYTQAWANVRRVLVDGQPASHQVRAGRPAARRPRMTAATLSTVGLRLLAHHDLGGHGDGMQVLREGRRALRGPHRDQRMGTSILDVADPARPVLVAQWPAPPRTHTHKVQVAGGLLLVNHEKFPYRARGPGRLGGPGRLPPGRPARPEQVGFWPTGPRRAPGRLDRRPLRAHVRDARRLPRPIWMVVDLADPARPAEAARGGGRGSGTTRARPGRRASGTRRTTRCSPATAPTSATTTRAWSCWT